MGNTAGNRFRPVFCLLAHAEKKNVAFACERSRRAARDHDRRNVIVLQDIRYPKNVLVSSGVGNDQSAVFFGQGPGQHELHMIITEKTRVERSAQKTLTGCFAHDLGSTEPEDPASFCVCQDP